MLSGYDLRKHLMMVGGREISKKEKKNEKKIHSSANLSGTNLVKTQGGKPMSRFPELYHSHFPFAEALLSKSGLSRFVFEVSKSHTHTRARTRSVGLL